MICADQAGKPYDIHMVRSSGNKSLDLAAMRSAKSWKFPAQKADGTARPECEEVPIDFRFGG